MIAISSAALRTGKAQESQRTEHFFVGRSPRCKESAWPPVSRTSSVSEVDEGNGCMPCKPIMKEQMRGDGF